VAPPRTLIRGEDLRISSPQNPGVQKSEELYLQGRYFEADCLASDSVGDFVRITGNKVSGYYQVSKTTIATPSHMPAVGIIAEKSSLTRCFVQTQGLYITTGLIAGLRYWISTSSQLTSMMPIPNPGDSLIAQVAGQSLSDTELILTLSAHVVKLRG
jgi:hypothetical protein